MRRLARETEIAKADAKTTRRMLGI
jgi:hypothetical protein